MTLAVWKRCAVAMILPVIFLGELMRRFVEEADRGQWTLLPECLDFIDESNPVRVIDVFVDALDLAEMSFEGIEPAATGRPSYHPSVLLKLYISGYLNRVQSSRRLEREARPPGLFHYVAAKAAIGAFTRCLALEIGTRNVNANCVAQGAIRTALIADIPTT